MINIYNDKTKINSTRFIKYLIINLLIIKNIEIVCKLKNTDVYYEININNYNMPNFFIYHDILSTINFIYNGKYIKHYSLNIFINKMYLHANFLSKKIHCTYSNKYENIYNENIYLMKNINNFFEQILKYLN